MPIRLHNVVAGIDVEPSRLRALCAERLGVPSRSIVAWRLVRRSLDVRGRRPRHVCTVDVALADDEGAVARRAGLDAVSEEAQRPPVRPGSRPLGSRPVIIGAGPAGLFAGLRLAQHGYLPLIVDRGDALPRRHRQVAGFLESGELNPESNLLFGAGGAGAYSDGKLRTRIHNPSVQEVLGVLAECGAPDDILYDARPHVGTDRLRAAVANLIAKIEALGGTFRFGCMVTDIGRSGSTLCALHTEHDIIRAGAALLATGSAARDTVDMLHRRGVTLAAKPFQMGLRIEHRQDLVDRAAYGRLAGHPKLGAAEYVLTAKPRNGLRGVTSFCVCPGGCVLPAVAEPDTLCTNGMSERARDSGWCNGALVATISPDEFASDPLAGVALQRRFERLAFALGGGNFRCPAQTAPDFLAGKTGPVPSEHSYPLGLTPADLGQVVPPSVAEALRSALIVFERRMPGFTNRHAVLVGPESRASSPVRIVRDPGTRMSDSLSGLFPVGEGAGYAGGIVSSAVDGLLSAEALIATHAPPANG